jgi:hypothetical protein
MPGIRSATRVPWGASGRPTRFRAFSAGFERARGRNLSRRWRFATFLSSVAQREIPVAVMCATRFVLRKAGGGESIIVTGRRRRSAVTTTLRQAQGRHEQRRRTTRRHHDTTLQCSELLDHWMVELTLGSELSRRSRRRQKRRQSPQAASAAAEFAIAVFQDGTIPDCLGV